MIFKEKYNNSLGVMCCANDGLRLLIADHLMDMPEDIINKIQKQKNFEVHREGIDLWFADAFKHVSLQSTFNNKTTLLRIYPLTEEDIKEMEVIHEDDIASMICHSQELAQIQYFKTGDDRVISYSAYLVKCEDGYQITLLKASSAVEEGFNPEEYIVEDYSDTFVFEEEVMGVIDTYKLNKSR